MIPTTYTWSLVFYFCQTEAAYGWIPAMSCSMAVSKAFSTTGLTATTKFIGSLVLFIKSTTPIRMQLLHSTQDATQIHRNCAKSKVCPARSELQWSDNPMFINVTVNFSLWTNMFPQNRASTFSFKDAPTCESPVFQTELQHKASKQSPYDQLLLFSHTLYIWICIWEHHPIILPLMN